MESKNSKIEIMERALARERAARHEAEQLLESKSTDLYDSNVQLKEATEALEQKVVERTADLQRTVEELHVVADSRTAALAELRLARDEALELMNERTTFLASISHELRTPLNAIVGLVHLLLQEELEHSQFSKLKTIDTSSRVLLTMINEILDFTKIDAGELKVNLEPADIGRVVADSIDLLTQEAKDKGVSIYFRARAGISDQLMIDQSRIGQILINLISNSVKFTTKGSVSVELDVIEGAGPVIQLTVEDTGSGINPERLEKIFLPFKQSMEGQLASAGGTGLGLAIVDRLCRLMGGEVTVQSELGKGSKFSVSIPTSHLNEEFKPLPTEPKPSQKPQVVNVAPESLRTTTEDAALEDFRNMGLQHSLQILVVDDNRVNREVVELQLQFLGYVADYVANGEEAIRAVMEREYDVVLMDISMPVMNGEEACIAIRKLKRIIQPQIIAVTASAMSGDKERYLRAGMNAYLAKPLVPLDLAKTLQGVARPANENKVPAALAQPTADQSAELVDMTELNQRLGSMAMPMLRKIVPVFLGELPGRLQKIENAFQQKSSEDLASLLHALKGSSSSTGAKELVSLCGRAEQLARSGETLDAELIQHIIECAQQTGVVLQTQLDAF